MAKIRRVRTGCWTCKKRRRKCDEAKPNCKNCVSTGRECEGYGIKLSFDVDDSRNQVKFNSRGEMIHGFRGRPRLKESLAKRMDQHCNEQLNEPSSEQLEKALDDFGPHNTPSSSNSSHSSHSLPPLDGQPNSLNHDSREPHFLGQILRNEPDFINQLAVAKSDTELINEFQKFQDLFPENDIIEDLEEQKMIKHFFKRLLPLLDAHPSTPWPQLTLKYLDYEVAKSCFISLGFIHIFESNKSLPPTGIKHVNNTMEYLINYLKQESNGELDIQKVIENLKFSEQGKQKSNFVMILLLIHINLLFTVVESGRNAILRIFFQLFSKIVSNEIFKPFMDECVLLVASLSWFDTITAVISPDYRLPYCEPTWYGNSVTSTTKLMGCPVEIFQCIHKLCYLRKRLHDGEGVLILYEEIKNKVLNYREYVEMGENYEMRLKCAQCWSLVVLLNLYKLVKPDIPREGVINEFIMVYSSMDHKSPLITQMVWPIFSMGCECADDFQKDNLRVFIDNLYEQVKMGTVGKIKEICFRIWETGETWEEILGGDEWFESGIEFLCV